MQKTKEQFMEEIERVLDTVREGLAMHSGNVELVDADLSTGQVKVRFQGMCVGCPMSDVTLKVGIEETLMQLLSDVKEVVQVE